jgi:hypothetical protein
MHFNIFHIPAKIRSAGRCTVHNRNVCGATQNTPQDKSQCVETSDDITFMKPHLIEHYVSFVFYVELLRIGTGKAVHFLFV